MKHLKKTMALALTMIMVLAMGMSAFAAPEDKIEATSGTITVKNAAKGEKYALYKIFDATISKVEGEVEGEAPDNTLYIVSFAFYVIYAFFGIWFKGCVHDIEEESHTKRTCTKIMIYLCLALKICANSMVSFRYCQGNKTGIIFVSMLVGIYFIHWNLNFIIYCCEIKFLLRTYWLGFLFYQISRFCILLFFLISIVSEIDYVEIYVYAAILCAVLIYMYLAKFF